MSNGGGSWWSRPSSGPRIGRIGEWGGDASSSRYVPLSAYLSISLMRHTDHQALDPALRRFLILVEALGRLPEVPVVSGEGMGTTMMMTMTTTTGRPRMKARAGMLAVSAGTSHPSASTLVSAPDCKALLAVFPYRTQIVGSHPAGTLCAISCGAQRRVAPRLLHLVRLQLTRLAASGALETHSARTRWRARSSRTLMRPRLARLEQKTTALRFGTSRSGARGSRLRMDR